MGGHNALQVLAKTADLFSGSFRLQLCSDQKLTNIILLIDMLHIVSNMYVLLKYRD